MNDPEDLNESIEWQQKLFDLNMALKGTDHEETRHTLERLIKLKQSQS
jgi:hypothetical protein